MSQDSITRCLGLVTQFNPLSTAPGALSKADDCVIRRENIVEDRRGYSNDATLANNIAQLLTYKSKLLAHNGTVMSYGPSSYSNYSGSYSAPTSQKMRFAEAASNLYTTTSLGVKVFTDVTGTQARLAGVPRALDPSYALNAAATGFLSNSYQCAYRCVLQKTDANSNVITGYPSQRLWVTNASGTSKNVDLTTYLPSEAAVDDVIQFYRTEQVSTTASDISGDEMGLVYQYSLTSTDVTNGYVTFTDSVTDALRGETLYSSPSQEGISQANERPPLCKDIGLYKSSMFYANCSTKQRLFVTLVGTSGLSGKTITLGGVTYNFGATEIVSGGGSPQAQVYASGVAATDIDDTARSLVRVINRYASNTTVYAYYLTGPDDLPGQIMIEEKGIGASAFTIQASDSTISGMFFPAPPVSPSTNSKSTSSNSVQLNGIYFSKNDQYEHVPSLNYFLVGAANKSILRIAALRESLIIIKEEGIYRLTGDDAASFVVTPLDLTVFCKSADSVAVLANQVFMLSNQGVVAIGENGVQVVSREIETIISPLFLNSSLSSLTCGVGYESERSYLISTVTDSTDTVQNQTLIYNVFTKTWVRWTFAFAAAVVEPSTDMFYFATPSSAIVRVERKTFSDNDYADPETAITISAISGTSVTFTITGAVPEVGDAISQGGTSIPIESLTINAGGSYTAVVASDPPGSWAAGAATLYPSVRMSIEWLPWTASNPAAMKQVRYFKILTDSSEGANTATSVDATFKTNFDEEQEDVSISQAGQGWGAGPWGSMPWGGGGDSYGYPTIVPLNKQYCVRMMPGVVHKRAFEKVSVVGCAFDFNLVSESVGR